MGSVLSNVLINPNYLKADHALKSACAMPNMIFWVDHICYEKGGSLCRHAVYENKEGRFRVIKRNTGFMDTNRRVWEENIGEFSHLYGAKKAIEQSVTLLEQDGWEFVEEKKLELYNVMDEVDEKIKKVTYFYDLNWVEATDVLGEGIMHLQKISSGLRFFVAFDPFGKVLVKPTCLKGGTAWEPATNCVLNAIGLVIKVDEARGCVLEVVLDGPQVSVLDIWYLHDKWLIDIDRVERHKLIDAYIKKNKVPVELLKMARAKASGAVNLIVDDITSVLAEVKGMRYLITQNRWEMHVSSSWKGSYALKDDLSLGDVGELDGRYLPDITYLTFNAAGKGLRSFWY